MLHAALLSFRLVPPRSRSASSRAPAPSPSAPALRQNACFGSLSSVPIGSDDLSGLAIAMMLTQLLLFDAQEQTKGTALE